MPIWWWSGDPLDPARLREQMELLIQGGVSQAIVLNLAPSGPLYGALADEPAFFTEGWWSVFLGVCRDAADLGFHLWFYDQLGFSGADIQGRLAQREPSYRGRALERVSGGRPDGAEVLVELDNGDALCSVPRGFDYLSAPACAALLDCVHGEFERRAGSHFGTTIVGSFQDELPSMPSWSADFAEQFTQRRGYDLLAVLPALWSADAAGRQVRTDYQRTRAELAEEAFFRPLFEWHEARGLAVGCDQQHPARAGHPVEATQQYGDYQRTHRWFTAPGSDHWGEAKVHSSLAHLYDRPRTWLEAFHSTGWGGTLEETYDWLLPWLRAGATLYSPHAVYYSTGGGRWEWAPPSTCWRQPYWRHYPLFALAVTRLCAALSWGKHVCDVGVLFPTVTVQADVDQDLPQAVFRHDSGISAAHDSYLDVVGRMHWFEPTPGVLDLAGRDFDVLDDDSLGRGELQGSALRIGAESYRIIVLPGCRELAPETVAALADFADAGGVLVAVGDVHPRLLSRCRTASTAELADVLADLPSRVIAPVPTLLRTDGESSVLMVVGAYPGATHQPGGGGWQTQGYDFDPSRYTRSVAVSVAGVHEPVAMWDPGTGASMPLNVRREGDVLHVDVSLSGGPCALLVFGPAAEEQLVGQRGDVFMAQAAESADDNALLQEWTAQVLPTLDNRWGDFARPGSDEPMPVEVWDLDHRPHGSEEWFPVTVTFGPLGEVRRHGQTAWSPVVWSEVNGSPLESGEQRGFVPEEFLDLGEVAAGEQTRVRIRIAGPSGTRGHLIVGSTAEIRIWWNGEELDPWTSVYYRRVDVEVQAANVLELELTAATARRLRASWVLRKEAETLPRPEWLTGTTLTRTVELTAAPDSAVLQLGSIGRVTLTVNGEVVARHGEFDNYVKVRQPRVRRYELRDYLAGGDNELRLELHEPESAVVIDAFLDDLCVVTDRRWDGVTGGPGEVPHDPRWVQLRPRPHTLRRGHELEGRPAEDSFLGQPMAPVISKSEEFRFTLPPGATSFELPVADPIDVTVDGSALLARAGEFHLASPAAAGSEVLVRVTPASGMSGGACWSGPVSIQADQPGAVALGDWTKQGLVNWSGGLRYRCVVPGPLPAQTLDLGRVRGTAEVRVNGRPAGCRIWSPYSLVVTGLFDQVDNVVEVDVYNTLAPYIGAVSSTRWVLPDQTESGLFGPVSLTVEDRTRLCEHEMDDKTDQGES